MKPNAIIFRASTFCTFLPMSGIIRTINSAPGESAMPDVVASQCITICMNCGSRIVVPNSAMPSTIIIAFAIAKFAFLKRRRSTSGSFERSVHQTKDTTPTTPAIMKPTMNWEWNQSSSCPLSSTTSSEPRPMTRSMSPVMSSFFPLAAAFAATRCGGSSTILFESRIEMIPTGTLMRKIQRQEKLSVM